jgi:protein-S-isoprenylcysteine O-methyltransferase Ste14
MAGLEHRVPPPLVAVLGAAGTWACWRLLPAGRGDFPGSGWLALVLALAAAALVLSAVLAFIRHRTTVDPLHPERASVLVTGGVFRLSRNPMYLAMALALGAWCLVWPHLAGPFWLAGFVLWIDRLQIVPEERFLSARFGADFATYRARVRRWL